MIALAPLLLQAAPFLSSLFFGDKTGTVVQKAADIMGSALGVSNASSNPAALQEALAKADPGKMIELQAALAKFAHEETQARIAADQADKQREHDEILKRLADVQGARGMYSQSQKAVNYLAFFTVFSFFAINTMLFWGYYSVLVSGVKITNFEVALAVANAVGILAGFVNAKTDMVYGFFFGSSVSARANSQATTSALSDVARAASQGGGQIAADERAKLLAEAKRLGLNVPADMPLEGLRAAVDRAQAARGR